MRRIADVDDGRFWRNLLFGLTGVALLLYLKDAFLVPGSLSHDPFAIQDDARQFLAWMPRLVDPSLLRDDLLADYWQSVSPPVYRLLFQAGAWLGIDPRLVARLLPVPLIAASAVFAWRVSMALARRPVAAFVAAAAVLALVIHEDSVYTATPRAFSPPLFLIFLDALLRDRGRVMVASLFVLAAIYPTTALVGLAMMGLSRVRLRPRPAIDLSRRSVLLLGGAALAILVAIVPFQTQTSRWEPVLTLAEARSMPNLNSPEGRSSIVDEEGAIGWLCSARVGFVPEMVPCGRGIPLAGLANVLLLVPLLLAAAEAARRPHRPGEPPGDIVFAWALIAALAWYAVAVALAFRLHLPSRYSQRVLSIMEWLAIGRMLGVWLDARLREGLRSARVRVGAGIIALLLLVSFLTPTPGIRRPADSGAISYIASSPPETRVAGISEDLDFVPALTGRPVLATTEHSIPYHLGYFGQVRERLQGTLTAASTSDPAELARFVRQYRIDLFAIEPGFLNEGHLPARFTTVVPEAVADANAALAVGPSVLQRRAAQCEAYRGAALVLLDAQCLVALDLPDRTPAPT